MATQLFQPQHSSVEWFRETVAKAKIFGIITEVVDLTPALADEILKANVGNRAVRQTKMAQYAVDMAAGRWVFNGEPIIISIDGQMNDGQHRALAVIDANTTIKTLMVFGVDRDSRTTVDQGGARGSSDYAQMEGIQNASSASAIARLVIAYDRAEGQNFHLTRAVTNAEVMQRLHDDANVHAAAHFSVAVGRHAREIVAGSQVGFCFYVLSRISRTDAETYLTQISVGENLRRGDPAMTVREKLLTVGKSRDRNVAVILRGWNFYRRQRKVKVNGLVAVLPLPALM